MTIPASAGWKKSDCPEGIPVSDKKRKYYTLVPVFHGGKIYIPVDTKAFIRRIISHGEAEALVEKIPEIRKEVWNL